MKNTQPSLFESNNLSALYIENDDDIRMDSKKLLESVFENVILSNNYEEGFHLYKEYYKKNNEYLDVVIMDISISALDGGVIFQSIKNINIHQRIIITSNQKEINFILDNIRLNIDEYLIKPINKDKYVDSLQRIIQKVKYTRQNKENENKVNSLIHEKVKIIQEQKKMAQLGSLWESIAHQWKQPLNMISIMTSGMDFYIKNNISIKEKELESFILKTQMQVEYMSETIDGFKNFYDNSRKINTFKTSNMLDSILLLMKNEFIMKKIDVHVHIHDDITISANQNEFKHILINILNNSIEAFESNNTKNRTIDIYASVEDKWKIIKIEDNAGGIPEKIINNIFIRGTSTKTDKVGSGIGLNFASKILEKFGWKVDAKNIENHNGSNKGARFTIRAPSA